MVPQMGPDDYDRTLGVIEAITLAGQQCPNAMVRLSADHALEAIRKKGATALPMQASLVMTSMQGWRGERASQIQRSLEEFLATQQPKQSDAAS